MREDLREIVFVPDRSPAADGLICCWCGCAPPVCYGAKL